MEQRHQLLEGHPGRPDQGHRAPQPAAYQVAVADDAQAGDLRFQILAQQHALTAVCRGCDDMGRLLFVVQQGEDVAHLAFELRPVEQVLLTAQKYVGLCGVLQDRSGCADDRNQLRVDLAAQLCQQPVGQVHRRNEGQVAVEQRGQRSGVLAGESVRMLDAVKMPEARKRMKMYPHEFSGGMRQRVMIAMALLCRPKLLIADEPTTALDVTVQAQIMTLLNELKREFNTAIIMITHDLGVVAGICDKVLVMYAGRTMEYGNARDVFYQPVHPYSIGLLNAVPRLDAEGETMLTIPGNPPNLLRLPKGCPFQPRCPHAMEICSSAPPLEEFTPGRLRACFKPVEELL